MIRTALFVISLTALCACEENDQRSDDLEPALTSSDLQNLTHWEIRQQLGSFERASCDALEDLEREHELDECEFDERGADLERAFDQGLEDLEREREFEREDLEQSCQEDPGLDRSPEKTGPGIPVEFDHAWSHVLDPAPRLTDFREGDEARDRDDECHDAREDLEREFDELREDLERERELEREDLERLRDEVHERFEGEAEDLGRECSAPDLGTRSVCRKCHTTLDRRF